MLDTVIAGAGPAGLSAALLLGRCLRGVALCDEGHPRNEHAELFNGFLSRDASSPHEFLRTCREQLHRYENVNLFDRAVTRVELDKEQIRAVLQDGTELVSRTLLLATGMQDVLPDIRGLKPLFGKVIHTCPYCHGWECRGQPLGVLGGDQAAADLAIELRQWSDDVVLYANGRLSCNRKARKQLEAWAVKVEKQAVIEIEGRGTALQGVRLADGSLGKHGALFVSPAQRQGSPLAEQLGCKLDKQGCIKTDGQGRTNVPGVYAAGNACWGLQLVIVAAAQGAIAAAALNVALIEADAQAARR